MTTVPFCLFFFLFAPAFIGARDGDDNAPHSTAEHCSSPQLCFISPDVLVKESCRALSSVVLLRQIFSGPECAGHLLRKSSNLRGFRGGEIGVRL